MNYYFQLSARFPSPARTALDDDFESSSRCVSRCLLALPVLPAVIMGRSAKVSRMGMPAFDKNKKMSANAASGKPQSAQASGSAIKKAAPKKKVEKKKASFKGDTFAGKPSKKA